jgi:hypothetical protein
MAKSATPDAPHQAGAQHHRLRQEAGEGRARARPAADRHEVEVIDHPAMRGMIQKVRHIVTVVPAGGEVGTT